jgi:Zn-dependent protease
VTELRSPAPELEYSGETCPSSLGSPVPFLSRFRSRFHARSPFMEYGLPLLLFALSVGTTTAIGARFMHNFLSARPAIVNESDLWPWPWLLQHPGRFLLGWPFSATLLGILLTHEFGHYFACRAHGIRATLPWVLPAPTLSGTAGAVIQLRSRIPNRHALIDVGIYGPLAGYAASLIAVAVGFLLSHPAPPGATPALVDFGEPVPLTLSIISRAMSQLHPGIATFEHATRHPVLIAGWVGLFITSLNLIPGGQLDGGHILYALSPRWHRIVTRILPVALLVCGFFFWVGWLLWGLILLIPAMRHPYVPMDRPLGAKRILLCALALAVFALTFSAEPFAGSSIQSYLH